MQKAKVPIYHAESHKLYPRPYVPVNSQAVKGKPSTEEKFTSPLAALDKILEHSANILDSKPIPQYRWENNYMKSPSAAARTLLIGENSLLVVFYGNRLQVYNVDSHKRLFEYVFEDEFGNTMWPVTCVVECSLKAQQNIDQLNISSSTILVSVMRGATEGKIYLIDYLSAATLIHMDVPFAVTSMLPAWSSNHSTGKFSLPPYAFFPQGIFTKLSEPLVLGTRGGMLAVMDLHFDHSVLRNNRSMKRGTEEVKEALQQFNPDVWSTARDGLIHPWFDLTYPFTSRESIEANSFDYLDPKEGQLVGDITNPQRLSPESVCITALHIVWPLSYISSGKSYQRVQDSMDNEMTNPSETTEEFQKLPSNIVPDLMTPLLFVGYNFGCYQIWALDMIELIYCSSFKESRSPITCFETQSLHTLPGRELNFHLWVGRGSVCTPYAQQAHYPSISCYSISFLKLLPTELRPPHWNPVAAFRESITRVVPQYNQILPSSFVGNYYGIIHTLKALPCWENPLEHNHSIAFAWETFPETPKQRYINPSSFQDADRQQVGGFEGNTKAPTKTLNWLIFSLPSNPDPSDPLFPQHDVSPFLEPAIWYDMDQLAIDSTHVLGIYVLLNRVQNFSLLYGENRASNQVNASKISFDAVTITDDTVSTISYLCADHQTLDVIAQLGPSVFDSEMPHSDASKILRASLSQSGIELPQDDPGFGMSRTILLQIALFNGMSNLICDYTLGCINRPASSKASDSAQSILTLVSKWALRTYSQQRGRVEKSISSLLGEEFSSIDFAYEMWELRGSTYVLSGLYNIFKSLQLAYRSQKQKTLEEEEPLREILETLTLAIQFVETSRWLIEFRYGFEISNQVYHNLKSQITSRRATAKTCFINSALNWELEAQKSGIHATTMKAHLIDTSKQQTDLLMIDFLVSQINDTLLLDQTTDANQPPFKSFSYPPSSLLDLSSLSSYSSSSLISQKHQVIIYFLLDVCPAVADSFARRMLLPVPERALIRGLRLLDCNDYESAMACLNDPQVTEIISDELALRILRRLLDSRAYDLALQFYRTRQPPVDSLETSVLVLYVLLTNGLTTDAFLLARTLSRPTLDSYEPVFLDTLFFHFLRHLDANKSFQMVFELPLDEVEVDVLKRYLINNKDESTSNDLILAFLIQRTKFKEAIEFYNTCNKPSDALQHNEAIKAGFINTIRSLLPPVLQKSTPPVILEQKGKGKKSILDIHALRSPQVSARQAAYAPFDSATASPFNKKQVKKLFGSPGMQLSSPSVKSQAALGPALLSPTTPAKFGRTPAMFRPVAILSQNQDAHATPRKPETHPKVQQTPPQQLRQQSFQVVIQKLDTVEDVILDDNEDGMSVDQVQEEPAAPSASAAEEGSASAFEIDSDDAFGISDDEIIEEQSHDAIMDVEQPADQATVEAGEEKSSQQPWHPYDTREDDDLDRAMLASQDVEYSDAPPVISSDSVHAILDASPPISTPTKRVLQGVYQETEEVRRTVDAHHHEHEEEGEEGAEEPISERTRSHQMDIELPHREAEDATDLDHSQRSRASSKSAASRTSKASKISRTSKISKDSMGASETSGKPYVRRSTRKSSASQPSTIPEEEEAGDFSSMMAEDASQRTRISRSSRKAKSSAAAHKATSTHEFVSTTEDIEESASQRSHRSTRSQQSNMSTATEPLHSNLSPSSKMLPRRSSRLQFLGLGAAPTPLRKQMELEDSNEQQSPSKSLPEIAITAPTQEPDEPTSQPSRVESTPIRTTRRSARIPKSATKR